MVDTANDAGARTARASPLFLGALVGLLVFGIAVGGWMGAPFDDWVPLVAPGELPVGVDPDELPASAQFRCSAAIGEDESAVATKQAAEALEVQELTRTPCTGARAQHRTIGVLNLAVVGFSLLVLGWTARRRSVGRRAAQRTLLPASP